jgi:hypothetical protein
VRAACVAEIVHRLNGFVMEKYPPFYWGNSTPYAMNHLRGELATLID